jgi:proprotein convertase subtilisin/kexin type 2
MCLGTTRIMHRTLLPALIFLVSCGGGGGATPAIPPAPANVIATARDSNNLISWTAVNGATSYNIYWSNAAGVNKSSLNKIALAKNPQAHVGLVNGMPYYYVVTAVGAGGESTASAQVGATPVAVIPTSDPLYGDQWNLKNIGQLAANGAPGISGEDMNVEPAWVNYKGNGIRIVVVDDGLEIGHEDLAANVAAGLSFNYVNFGTDPSYESADIFSGHGTSVAGIAAARDQNGLGGSGVAPRANLVGYNLLQSTKFSDEADAMTRGSQNVDIYTNSWGPPDGYGALDASESIWRTAIDYGVASGRGGLGNIYIWAAGNGATGSQDCWHCVDNANYDGYANYRGVIAVAAVNDQGQQSSYSESGANLWISAPGGEFCDTHAIITTDRTGAAGDNPAGQIYGYLDYPDPNYTRCMNGTSAAAPAVAGVVALMLQARPVLTERDVRLILAQSARKNDPADAGWAVTGGTPVYHFNHKYGFGVVDAAAAVTLAQTWTNIGPQLISSTFSASPNQAIPDFPGAAKSSSINVSGSGINSIEFVEITFSSNHTYSGNLDITLTSPAGTISHLANTHDCAYGTCTPYSGWVFGSAAHLGEAADGMWSLTVKDRVSVYTGTFQSWSLKFYGH